MRSRGQANKLLGIHLVKTRRTQGLACFFADERLVAPTTDPAVSPGQAFAFVVSGTGHYDLGERKGAAKAESTRLKTFGLERYASACGGSISKGKGSTELLFTTSKLGGASSATSTRGTVD